MTGVHKSTLIIADGGTTSEAFHVLDYSKGSIKFPTGITSTGFVIEVSNDGTNWETAPSTGSTAMSSVTITNHSHREIPQYVFSFEYARVKVGSAETGAKTLILRMGTPK